MTNRHILSANLDERLVAYSNTSWNAYEAVYALQQLACLLPLYRRDLIEMYGAEGVGDARRAWGVMADLVGAMTGDIPSVEMLVDYGFDDAEHVGRIIVHGGQFSLWRSPVLKPLDFREAVLGDIDPLLLDAQIHDTLAKPLLKMFKDELQAYNDEALAALDRNAWIRTFRDLARTMPAEPHVFPAWDDRPLFLDEQKALIDYLAKMIGAEIIANSLVDEKLGEFLLRQSAVVVKMGGTDKLDINVVAVDLQRKPLELVFHQAGNAALEALKSIALGSGTLERLYAVESAVRSELGIDISPALATSRMLAVDRQLDMAQPFVVDLRDDPPQAILPYNFPTFDDK